MNTTAVDVQTQMPFTWYSEGPVPSSGGSAGSAFKFSADSKQVYDTPERLCVELALHLRHVCAQQLIIAKQFARVLSVEEASTVLAPIFAACKQLQVQVNVAADKISLSPSQPFPVNLNLRFVPLSLSGKENLKQLLLLFTPLLVNVFTILADANRLNLIVLTAHPAARLSHLQQAGVVLSYLVGFEQPLFMAFTRGSVPGVVQLGQNMLPNYSTMFPSLGPQQAAVLLPGKESKQAMMLPSSDGSWGDLLGPVVYDHTLIGRNVRSTSSASIITLINDCPSSGISIDFGGTLFLPKTVSDSGCDMCVLLSAALLNY